MASSHKTEHYGLSQFAPLDRPAWLVDYNTDMEKIDTALHNLDETGGGGGTLDQTARDMAQAAQDAAKDAQGMATAAQATADEALEKAEEALNQQETVTGDITNINEEITQIKNDVNTAQSTATTANETAEEALELAQGCVKKSGDTMTGVLKLAGNPVDDADAANKGYVDSLAGNPFPDNPYTDNTWKGGYVLGAPDPIAYSLSRPPREIMLVCENLTNSKPVNFRSFSAAIDGASENIPLTSGSGPYNGCLTFVFESFAGGDPLTRLVIGSESGAVYIPKVDNDYILYTCLDATPTAGKVTLYWR